MEIAFDFGPGVYSLAVALIVLEVSLVAGTVGAMRESSRTISAEVKSLPAVPATKGSYYSSPLEYLNRKRRKMFPLELF